MDDAQINENQDKSSDAQQDKANSNKNDAVGTALVEKPSGQINEPGSIFGSIDDIKKSIQRYRDKFVFNYDK